MAFSWGIFCVLIVINITIWLLVDLYLDDGWVELKKLTDYKKRNL